MSCAIPEDKRNRVKGQLAITLPTKLIAKQTNMSRRTVQRFQMNLTRYGTARPPKIVPQGRPRVITPEMEKVRYPNLPYLSIGELKFRRLWIILLSDRHYTLMNKHISLG